MKFTVNRSKWRCGSNGEHSHGEGDTELLNKEGFQCCLGFVCEQLGVPRENLLGVDLPCNAPSVYTHEQVDEILLSEQKHFDESETFTTYADLESHAVAINDSLLPRKEKEAKLISLFAVFGHKLEFIGEYSK